MLLATAAVALAIGGCGSSGTKTVSVSSALPSEGATQRTTTTGTTKSSPTTTTPTSTSHEHERDRRRGNDTHQHRARVHQRIDERRRPWGGVALVKAHGYTAGETSDLSPRTDPARARRHPYRIERRLWPAGLLLRGRALHRHRHERTQLKRQSGRPERHRSDARLPPLQSRRPARANPAAEKTVRFQLNNGRLVALDPIPRRLLRATADKRSRATGRFFPWARTRLLTTPTRKGIR